MSLATRLSPRVNQDILRPCHLGGLTVQNFFSAGVGWLASSHSSVKTAL